VTGGLTRTLIGVKDSAFDDIRQYTAVNELRFRAKSCRRPDRRFSINLVQGDGFRGNVEGRRFEDVTESSRTGHLQKGHGISFADWDCDGDLDVFCVLGGAFPGDQAYNVLFQNPGHGHHSLKIKLVGTRTNRSAIGARIRADLEDADGRVRSVYRVIGNNGSFGGNPLVETIGLGAATSVTNLTVTWPTSRTTQVFPNVASDQLIVITEGTDSYRVIRQSALKPPASR
jgi:hypothetical protein